MPTYCKMYIYWTFEKLLWYGTIEEERKESMMDCQSGLEGFMRVPITMWTAVIWFKLLKGRETSSERDSGWKEECVAKRNGEMDLYQIAPFGIQATVNIVWLGILFFHCGWTSQFQILYFFPFHDFRVDLREDSDASKSSSQPVCLSLTLSFLHAEKCKMSWMCTFYFF